MCGRLVRLRATIATINGNIDEEEIQLHGVSPSVGDLGELGERFNMPPTSEDFFIRELPDGRRERVRSLWGLVPRWAKDRSSANKTFNARSETLLEKPAFRHLVARNRCVIGVTGFHEWTGPRNDRRPHFISRADGEPMYLAGLWDTWRNPATGETMHSHTIVTCESAGLMAMLHHRMPVILDRAGVDLWLDPSVTDPAAVLPLLVPCPEGTLREYEVDKSVGNVRNDGPELLDPLS